MPSLKRINAEAGTNFRRTTELVAALQPREEPPMPEESEFPPRITNERVIQQMRGAGYQLRDGYPVKAPQGGKDFQTGDVTWRFDGDGNLISAWEPVGWNDMRDTMFNVIVEEPMQDGQPNFQYHHAWINYNYTETKLGRIRGVPAEIAAKRVAWFHEGAKVNETTVGALLQQSLAVLEG